MKSLQQVLLFVVATGVLGSSTPASAKPASSEDTPLKIIQTGAANFPVHLANAGILNGRVRAVVNIDANGKLADYIVTAQTHPDFVREMVDCLRAWEYEPARQQGKSVGTRAELWFLFEAQGMVISLDPAGAFNLQTNHLFDASSAVTSLTSTAARLDRPLTAVEVVQPHHPGKLLTPEQPLGDVTLDFYVDAEGRPRMPVAIQTSHDAFAVAAIDALMKWKFVPPTSAGRPVAVRVQQKFTFRWPTEKTDTADRPKFSSEQARVSELMGDDKVDTGQRVVSAARS